MYLYLNWNSFRRIMCRVQCRLWWHIVRLLGCVIRSLFFVFLLICHYCCIAMFLVSVGTPCWNQYVCTALLCRVMLRTDSSLSVLRWTSLFTAPWMNTGWNNSMSDSTQHALTPSGWSGLFSISQELSQSPKLFSRYVTAHVWARLIRESCGIQNIRNFLKHLFF